ncbi:MAG: hypothetical protein JXR70_13870 [Spirochaetales bacterium]|nr:hypothetical protein [Spirochaetales bacterium]
MKKMISILLLSFLFFPLLAQSSDDSDDLMDIDGLFENDEMVNERAEDAVDANLDTVLLTSEQAVIGGSFHFKTNSSWYPLENDDFFNPESVYFNYSAALRLFLDARPNEDFRVFVKSDITYPFTYLENGNINLNTALKLKEIFVDFDWDNKVFFRVGKQTAKWGVGYYYSPADVLSLSPINIFEPEAEREGPVSLKAHVPIGLNNAYLFLIADEISKPQDIAIAPKFEFIIDSTEIGFSGYYQAEKSPKLIATATAPLFQTNVFAEAVLSYGSDKTFIIKDDSVPFFEVSTETREEDFFFNGTIGLLATDSDDETGFNYTGYLQFFYNGEGYDDPKLALDAIQKMQEINKSNPIEGIGLLNLDYMRDLIFIGKYYLTGSLSTRDLYKSGIGITLMGSINFSDMSLDFRPSVSYEFNNNFTLTASCPMTFGEKYHELSINGNTFEPGLGVNLFGNTEIKYSVPIVLDSDNTIDTFSFKIETTFGATDF